MKGIKLAGYGLTATLLFAAAPVLAQSIAAVSAIVETLGSDAQGHWGAQIRVSMTGADGKSIKLFDQSAGPFPKTNFFASYGAFTIATQLCGSFPSNLGPNATTYGCAWVNMPVVMDTVDSAAATAGYPGVYVLNTTLDDSPFDNNQLNDRTQDHPVLVKAEILPGRGATYHGSTKPAVPIAQQQVLTIWPAIK